MEWGTLIIAEKHGILDGTILWHDLKHQEAKGREAEARTWSWTAQKDFRHRFSLKYINPKQIGTCNLLLFSYGWYFCIILGVALVSPAVAVFYYCHNVT
jgi:predicted outer membrane lipoprotein